MVGLVKVLFVSVSVVARPTNVSVDVGRVSVPVLLMVLMTGAVSVLFVRVLVLVRVGTVTPPTVRVPLIAKPLDVTCVMTLLPMTTDSAFPARP